MAGYDQLGHKEIEDRCLSRRMTGDRPILPSHNMEVAGVCLAEVRISLNTIANPSSSLTGCHPSLDHLRRNCSHQIQILHTWFPGNLVKRHLRPTPSVNTVSDGTNPLPGPIVFFEWI